LYIWGLQIGLNFVPATKTETRFRQTMARQALIVIAGLEIEFFCRLNVRRVYPEEFRGWFFDIYIQGSKKVQL